MPAKQKRKIRFVTVLLLLLVALLSTRSTDLGKLPDDEKGGGPALSSNDTNLDFGAISESAKSDAATVMSSLNGFNRPSSNVTESSSVAPPQIAWLISFPNSGTSYTIVNTRQVSGKNVATNYAQEIEPVNMARLVADSPNGPFYDKASYPLPQHFVLTKTHCGGYCSTCPPKNFVIPTTDQFYQTCARSTMETPHGDRLSLSYPRELAKRAIHLIRHPLDNMVSRLHLYLSNHKLHEAHQRIARQSTERDRLFKWCEWIKNENDQALRESKMLPDRMKNLILSPTAPPCSIDLFRYVQWHNRAMQMTTKYELPVHYLFYEDYMTNYTHTVEGVLDFLHQTPVHTPHNFVSNKTYAIFTPEEKQATAEFLSKLASPRLWQLLKPRYFA